MPKRFIDPATGEPYDVDEGSEQSASGIGLVPEEQYAADQAHEAKPFAQKADERVKAFGAGLGRGAVKFTGALGLADPETPEEQAQFEEFQRKAYGPEGQELRERYPVVSGIAESAPIAASGAALGGAAVGFRGAAAVLGAESAAGGISQEAIDATMAKRDFSAKAALANGALELTLGALGFGAGKVIGSIGATRVVPVSDAAAGIPGPRNFISEIDPGVVPPTARPARSVGAAAAANRNYVGDAAEEFTDDVWDAAAKSIDDANAGKGLPEEARFLADPKNADPMLELAAANTADNLDNVRRIVRDDISFGVKVDDFRAGAADWTPEMTEAQSRWLADEIQPMAAQVVEAVKATKGLGGFESRTIKALQLGLERTAAASGAERNVAVDHFKRGVAGVIRDLAGDMKTDLGAKTELVGALRPLHDTLREGLEDEVKFGANALLQKATNEPLTRLIEPLSRVEQVLSQRLGSEWGAVGQAAANRETRAEAVKSMLTATPSAQREFARNLNDALAGIEDLAAARQSRGLSRLENLPALKRGLQEIRADFNLGNVIQIAQRKAGELGGGFGEMAADAALDAVGGRIPLVGGVAKRGARGLLESFTQRATKPGAMTPLGQALEQRLKAYSRNPDLGNAGLSRLLPSWLRDSLKGHGGQVAGAVGTVGAAAALLAPGEAGATELPQQRMAREAYQAKLSQLPPEAQGAAMGTAEAFARIAKQTETRVSRSIAELFQGKATEPPSKAARAIEARAFELDVPRAVARFMGRKTDDPVVAWGEKRKLLSDVMADPARLARAMAENLGQLPQVEPEIFMRMVSETMATIEYLHALAPQPSGKSVFDPEGFPPSTEEITSWAGHWVGALHPLDTLDDLAANDLVPEQLETVKARHPDTFALFQQTALGEIGRIRQSKKRIPMQLLEQIDSALELNGAGEPVLSWEMARLIQMGEQQAAQTGAQPPQASPMQSKGAERVASSAMASIRPEAGAQ
jgi:hypothetical protein